MDPIEHNPGPEPAEAEAPDIRDFIAMLYRHRWASLLVFLVVTAVGALYTFRLTPVYASTPALLEVTSAGAGISTVRDVFEREMLTNQNFETLVQVLKSDGILRAAWDTIPEVQAKMTYKEFTESVTVAPVRNSFLVRITFESPFSEMNPIAANAVARTFIQVTREQREARTSRAGVQLEGHRDQLRKDLEAAEGALAKFRTTSGKADVRAEKEGVDRLLADFEGQYDKERLGLISLEKARNEVVVARKAGNLGQVGMVLQSPAYQEIERAIREAESKRFEILREYSETSKMLKPVEEGLALLEKHRQEVIQAFVAKIETDFDNAQTAVTTIGGYRDARRKEQQDLARLLIEQTNLESDRDRIKRDLDDVVKQTSDVQGTVGFDLSPAILHEEARASAVVPAVPVRPKPLRDMILTVLLGLLLAVGTAYLFEQFNDAALRPEEVTRATGLPILGMLPRLSGGKEKADVAALVDPKGELAEAVRIIRTGILYTPSGTAKRQRILITSAESGEGKTLLSTNLAVALAQAGQNTLLVDCDLRKPRLHHIFNLDNHEGLTHIFSNGTSKPRFNAVPREARLHVVSSGPIPPNPAELLIGDRMGEFLAGASRDFDRVILDSPPAGPVSDPSLLAGQVDAVILVVQLGKTSIRAIRRACDHLNKVGAPMLGVVLNGVVMGGGYYYYYRRYGYEYGYSSKDKRTPDGVPEGSKS